MNAARTARSLTKRVSGLSYRTRLLIGASIAGIGVLAAGATAYALWSAQDTVSGATIEAGDLDLAYGVGTWQQITEGVAAPAGGPLSEGTSGFHSMPGDAIEVRLPLTTTLRGDNLNAMMNVDMGAGSAQDLEDGVISAVYYVENADQESASEEAEPGTPVHVEGLVGSNDGVTASWTVVVTVSVLGDYRWTDAAPITDLDSWSLDGIDVTLEQTRSGAGFETERAGS